jgi:hypothetical protein
MEEDPLALTAFLLTTGKTLLGKENKYQTFISMIVEKLVPHTNSKDNFSDGLMGGLMSRIVSIDELSEKRSSVLINLEIIMLLKEEIEEKSVADNQWKKIAAPILRAAQVKYLCIKRLNPYIIFCFSIYCMCIFSGWR